MPKKTPQLRVCVIPYCNLRCVYCGPGGEGYAENLHVQMGRDEINQIIRVCADVGFTHVKFTGGEPLLRSDMIDVISDTRGVEGIQEIQLVTNGTLLARYARQLKDAGLHVLTLSTDAAEPEAYRAIRGGDLEPVLEGLRKCRDVGLPVRVNTVLMKRNLDQVEPLIALASRTGPSLKFLDLYDLQQGAASHDFWRREFLHFGGLRNRLERMGGRFVGYEEAPGGIGAPLLEFHMPDGLQVVLKDATEGTYYADYCLTCNLYPCQDALISLRVTHDGHLKMCLIRNDNLLDILTPLRLGDVSTVKKHVKERFDILASAKYYPHKWQPKLVVSENENKQQARDALLVEYEACVVDVSQLDSNVWQSGTVFVGLSVAGISILIQTQARSWGDLIVCMALSAFGLYLLRIWQMLVNDWLRKISINLIRMREIEHETGMQRERLIQRDEEENGSHRGSGVDKLFEVTKRFPGKRIGGPPGVRKILKSLVGAVAWGWIVLLAKQLAYLLLHLSA